MKAWWIVVYALACVYGLYEFIKVTAAWSRTDTLLLTICIILILDTYKK